jgi:oxygen-dependent protoporphyrinogen oxidase
MSENLNKPFNVVVIGGGITGLSACWYLQTLSDEPLNISLVESSSFLGGKMVTEKINENGNTFIIDAGPESFVTRKPEAWELALELGLEEQIINPGSETRNMYVLDGGTPKKIPLSPPAFITSDLLSFGGKLRMLLEPFIPARRDDEDESLAAFVSRRLGEEALEKMIGPVLAGIYNTDPTTQSIMTTSPVMREMEKEHGGLFKGAFARMRARKKQTEETPRRPQFMTFTDGAQVMVDALEAQLAIQVLKGTQALEIKNYGAGYIIVLENHDPLQADAVILAIPGNQASKLLSQVDPDSASLIGGIEQKNIGTASLIFASDQIEMPFEINGLMIPRRENRRIDAITWTTKKPIPRGPEGYEMVRVFFGGGDASVVTMPEEEIIETILAELKDILGITATPLKTAVFCWPETFPQANVGHLELVDEIEAQLSDGVYVAGNSFRGIGIPDCIRQGRDAAQKAIHFLNNTN